MPSLFIIAGCNGAGKTTASYTVLPEMLHIKEFVNADEIAKGLSPFQPENVAIEAGRIMISRINDLLTRHVDFGIETTLSSKSLVGFVKRAKQKGYIVNLLFYWLINPDLAVERVKFRVSAGGHYIPENVIVRRYYAGLKNLLTLYSDNVDSWLLIDNSTLQPELIAEMHTDRVIAISNHHKWETIKNLINDDKF